MEGPKFCLHPAFKRKPQNRDSCERHPILKNRDDRFKDQPTDDHYVWFSSIFPLSLFKPNAQKCDNLMLKCSTGHRVLNSSWKRFKWSIYPKSKCWRVHLFRCLSRFYKFLLKMNLPPPPCCRRLFLSKWEITFSVLSLTRRLRLYYRPPGRI